MTPERKGKHLDPGISEKPDAGDNKTALTALRELRGVAESAMPDRLAHCPRERPGSLSRAFLPRFSVG